MTVTDSPPTVAEAPRGAPSPASTPATRISGLLASGDHKAIGRLYVLSSLGFALFTLVIGVVAGLEQTDLGGVDIVRGTEAYLQVFELWRTGLVFLVVVPLFVGIATAVVPLQIGAPSVAFPRAASAAFWGWLLGSGVYLVGTFADGGLNAGGDSDAIELTILSLGLMIVSLLAATMVLVTTVITQRTEGMTLARVPFFSWTMLVAGGLWLLTLPVLLANLALLWVDLRGEVALFFETGAAAPGALRHLSWAFDQPQILLYALPLLGVVGELVPVTTGGRQPARGLMMGAVAGYGVLAIGAYAQPVYNPRVTEQPVFVVQNLILVLPLFVLLGGWAFALRSGRPKGTLPMGIAMGGLLMLLAGGAVGALRVFGRFVGGLREFDDWQWVDDIAEPFDDLAGSAAVAGQFRYVLFAGLIGGVAALYWWAPKMLGRRLSPAIGGLGALALIGGTVAASLSEVVNGFLDEPDIAVEAPVRDGVEPLNWIATAGLAVVAIGVLAVLADLALSAARRGDAVEDDPWGGHTLEWATTSPPPRNNFEAPVAVRSAAPLLDDDPDDGIEQEEGSA